MSTLFERLMELAKGEKPTGYLTNEDGNVFPVFDAKYKPKDMARHIEIVETIARNTKDPEKKAVHEARLRSLKSTPKDPHEQSFDEYKASPSGKFMRRLDGGGNFTVSDKMTPAAEYHLREHHKREQLKAIAEGKGVDPARLHEHWGDSLGSMFATAEWDATRLKGKRSKDDKELREISEGVLARRPELEQRARAHVAELKRIAEEKHQKEVETALGRKLSPVTLDAEHAKILNDKVNALREKVNKPRDYSSKYLNSEAELFAPVELKILSRLATGDDPDAVFLTERQAAFDRLARFNDDQKRRGKLTRTRPTMLEESSMAKRLEKIRSMYEDVLAQDPALLSGKPAAQTSGLQESIASEVARHTAMFKTGNLNPDFHGDALRSALRMHGYEDPSFDKWNKRAATTEVLAAPENGVTSLDTVKKRLVDHMQSLVNFNDARSGYNSNNPIDPVQFDARLFHPMYRQAHGGAHTLKELERFESDTGVHGLGKYKRNVRDSERALDLAKHVLPEGHETAEKLRQLISDRKSELERAQAKVDAEKSAVKAYMDKTGHVGEKTPSLPLQEVEHGLAKRMAPTDAVSNADANAATFKSLESSRYGVDAICRTKSGEWATNGHWLVKADDLPEKGRKLVEKMFTRDKKIRFAEDKGVPPLPESDKITRLRHTDVDIPDFSQLWGAHDAFTHELHPVGVDSLTLTHKSPLLYFRSDAGTTVAADAKSVRGLLNATGATSIRSSGSALKPISFMRDGKQVAMLMPMRTDAPPLTNEDMAVAREATAAWSPSADPAVTPYQTKAQMAAATGIPQERIHTIGHNSAIVSSPFGRELRHTVYARTPDGGWKAEPFYGKLDEVMPYHNAYSRLPQIATQQRPGTQFHDELRNRAKSEAWEATDIPITTEGNVRINKPAKRIKGSLLAVTKSGKGHSVTHTPTGLAVKELSSEADAKRYAYALGKSGVNWNFEKTADLHPDDAQHVINVMSALEAETHPDDVIDDRTADALRSMAGDAEQLSKGETPTGYLTNEDGNVFPVFNDKYQPKDMARHIEIVETIAKNTRDPEKRAVHESRLSTLRQSSKPDHTLSRAEHIERYKHELPAYLSAAKARLEQTRDDTMKELRLQQQSLASNKAAKYTHNEWEQNKIRELELKHANLEREIRNIDTSSPARDAFHTELQERHRKAVQKALADGEDIDTISPEFEPLKAAERVKRAKNPTTPEGQARLKAYEGLIAEISETRGLFNTAADRLKNKVYDAKKKALDRMLAGENPEQVATEEGQRLAMNLSGDGQTGRNAAKSGMRGISELGKKFGATIAGKK